MRKIYAAVTFTAAVFFAQAQTVQLDPNFGSAGLATTQISTPINEMAATAVQADGKILVGGNVGAPNKLKMGLTRFNADGTIDTSFADNGKKVFGVGDGLSFIKSIKIQPDGKIVLGGYAFSPNFVGDFAAVRLNADGSFDSTFGNNGIAVIDRGLSEVATSMALLQDGRIILAGNANDKFAMAMVKADGTVDNSFGDNGWAIAAFDEGGLSYVNDIAIQQDGKILLGGMMMADSPFYKMAAMRFMPDGTLDTKFAERGKFVFAFSGNNDFGINISTQSDGKIIFSGHTYFYNLPYLQYDVVSIRLDSEGKMDNTFGQNGLAKARFVPGENYTSAMKVQPDNKFVIVGNTVLEGNERRGYAARFTANGQLDNTFGVEGFIEISKDNRTLQASAIALPSNGDVIAGGEIFNAANGYRDAFVAKMVAGSLGVDNVTKNEVRVYPNPASDVLLVSGVINAANAKAHITNIAGQKVKSTTVSANGTINVSSLPAGVYILELDHNGTTTATRFIKK